MAHRVALPGKAIEASMLYSTTWKAERTTDGATQALRAGFQYIDTAVQPKYHLEDQMGDSARIIY